MTPQEKQEEFRRMWNGNHPTKFIMQALQIGKTTASTWRRKMHLRKRTNASRDKRIEELWMQGKSPKEIARIMGMTYGAVLSVKQRQGLPNIRRERLETVSKIIDPTPEEIRQRCAEIQAGWTEQQHEERIRGGLA